MVVPLPSKQIVPVRFWSVALMACSSTAEQSAVNRWVIGSNPIMPAL